VHSSAIADSPAIEIRSLTKTFGNRAALDAVDLDVEAGSVHGLLGLNGAGKTTLLRVLLGLMRPERGDVRLLGRALDDRHRLDGVAGFVGLPSAYPYLSGRRNLELLATLDRIADSDDRIDEVLADVGLEERSGDRVSGYSLGMRQRLAIAAALLRNPRLLILDEPTNGLDPAGARRLRVLLRSLASAGTTVLLSSHDMAEMDAVCDDVTVLHDGRVRLSTSLAYLRRSASAAAYRMTTSDDTAVLGLLADRGVTEHPDGGLQMLATEDDLDDVVVELGRRGIAVRRLSLAVAPLEQLFVDLVRVDAAPVLTP
jgi:ABC-2 type transport system ATP-binding protein